MGHVGGTDAAAIRNDIARLRQALAWRCLDLIRELDERDASTWPEIVATALEAGLSEADLRQGIRSHDGTVRDWLEGRSIPFPFTRSGHKERILALLAGRLGA